MQFAELLHREHIDPKAVLAMRHCPTEPKFRRVLPLLAAERPDLYNAYQQTQASRQKEKMLKRAGFLASFIGHEPGKALFIGLYRVDNWRILKPKKFRVIPAYKELNTKYWQPKRGWTAESGVWFDLELTDFYKEWSRRLVINWPGGERSWARWCHKNAIKFTVDHIKEFPVFEQDAPAWDEVVIRWNELQVLPGKWRITFSQWRGIYYIFDTSDGKGYVGAAYGDENIGGRWETYAKMGHGGNRELRGRNPESFEFSILQLVSQDMDASDVQKLEAKWKNRLHTRDYGLNKN